VFADLRAGWRLWAGAFLICLGAAAVFTLLAVFAGTVVHARDWLDRLPHGPSYAQLSEAAAMLSLFTVAPTVIVLAVVLGLLGQQTARQHATWRLSGALPGQVRHVIVAQAGITALVGAAAGLALALPFRQRAVNLLAEIPEPDRLEAWASPLWLGGVAVVMVVVGVAGASLPAFRASRRPAALVLAEPKPRRAMGPFRWVLLGLFGFVAVFGMSPPPGGLEEIRQADRSAKGSADAVADWVTACSNTGLAVAVLLAIAAPVVAPLVLRAWTALLPADRAPLWQLARHSAAAKLVVSTAAVTPLMVAVDLFGVYFGTSRTLSAVLFQGDQGASRDQLGHDLIALTPAVALAVIGSVAVLAMISRRRDRELAVLRAQTATSRDMSVMMLFEALIYAVTAALMAAIPLCVVAVLNALGIAAAGMPLSYLHLALVFPGVAFGAGLVLMTAVVLAAGAPAIRRPVAETLEMIPE
jgi:putative ABC transport system permease protein